MRRTWACVAWASLPALLQQASAGPIRSTADSTRCLSVAPSHWGGAVSEQRALILAPCTTGGQEDPDQQFTTTGTGPIHWAAHPGKCLYVESADGSTSDGLVSLRECIDFVSKRGAQFITTEAGFICLQGGSQSSCLRASGLGRVRAGPCQTGDTECQFNPDAAIQRYIRSQAFVDGDFISRFTFFSDKDPTHGKVEYVNESTARATGLVSETFEKVYLGADFKSKTGRHGRQSVRIESKAVWRDGLFVVSLEHVPTGCGTWPAMWLLGENPEHPWPLWGEYDIIEGTHNTDRVATTLHTGVGCSQQGAAPDDFSGAWQMGIDRMSTNCDIGAPGQYGNQGCSQMGPEGSLGTSFNSGGGGTYAAEWDPTAGYIRTWFWPHGQEPDDLVRGEPDPGRWAEPYSFFRLGDMCPAEHFRDMRLIFDLTFCGDLGEPTFASGCPKEAATMSCEELVANHPEYLQGAFWSIRKLDVYSIQRPMPLDTDPDEQPKPPSPQTDPFPARPVVAQTPPPTPAKPAEAPVHQPPAPARPQPARPADPWGPSRPLPAVLRPAATQAAASAPASPSPAPQPPQPEQGEGEGAEVEAGGPRPPSPGEEALAQPTAEATAAPAALEEPQPSRPLGLLVVAGLLATCSGAALLLWAWSGGQLLARSPTGRNSILEVTRALEAPGDLSACLNASTQAMASCIAGVSRACRSVWEGTAPCLCETASAASAAVSAALETPPARGLRSACESLRLVTGSLWARWAPAALQSQCGSTWEACRMHYSALWEAIAGLECPDGPVDGRLRKGDQVIVRSAFTCEGGSVFGTRLQKNSEGLVEEVHGNGTAVVQFLGHLGRYPVTVQLEFQHNLEVIGGSTPLGPRRSLKCLSSAGSWLAANRQLAFGIGAAVLILVLVGLTLPRPSAGEQQPPQCSDEYRDCRLSAGRCCDPMLTCYEQSDTWAACLRVCPPESVSNSSGSAGQNTATWACRPVSGAGGRRLGTTRRAVGVGGAATARRLPPLAEGH